MRIICPFVRGDENGVERGLHPLTEQALARYAPDAEMHYLGTRHDAYRQLLEEVWRDGHPENWGLWACGSLARVRSERLDAAMEDWWAECVRWTYQDQVSFPVVMRRHGIEVETFPFPQYGSPWFSIGGHARDE